MEDGAAVSGVLVAGACIGLASVTGNPLYDALGSIAVGGLLGGVAVFIVQKNRYSLMGRSIHPGQMARILRILLHERIIRFVPLHPTNRIKITITITIRITITITHANTRSVIFIRTDARSLVPILC